MHQRRPGNTATITNTSACREGHRDEPPPLSAINSPKRQELRRHSSRCTSSSDAAARGASLSFSPRLFSRSLLFLLVLRGAPFRIAPGEIRFVLGTLPLDVDHAFPHAGALDLVSVAEGVLDGVVARLESSVDGHVGGRGGGAVRSRAVGGREVQFEAV